MAGTVVNTSYLPIDCFDDPSRGRVTWQTIFSADRTPTSGLVCGVAQCEAGASLALHHHPEAELYYVLSGSGTLTLGDETFRLTAGVATFIPGGTIHGVKAESDGLCFLYVFNADSFADIAYCFVGAHSLGETAAASV